MVFIDDDDTIGGFEKGWSIGRWIPTGDASDSSAVAATSAASGTAAGWSAKHRLGHQPNLRISRPERLGSRR